MEAFFRQNASGQPVVQEVDSISTPLEETDRPNGPEVTSNIIATLSTTPVSEFKAILPSLLKYFQGRIQTFKAGSLAAYSHIWQELTSDPEVLETVTGQYIEFDSLPMQVKPFMQPKLSEIQTESVDLEITQLLKKGVIQPCQHEPGEFISPIFTRPKKDGSFRMILNLKCFNANVTHYHFKMDNIWSAIRLMKPRCYMASIDLKDAYYSVPICKDHQKFLKFEWKGALYQFVCFPNGLALCPRKFTKLLKPVFSLLRQQGHISVAYIDDSWLTADNLCQCTKNVIDTTSLLDKVGFVIHPEKSVLLPTQIITFLGFVLNSILMQVSLTPDRALKLKDACENLLATVSPSIRDVAQVLGLMTSSFPGVMYGPLHHRFLEMDKTRALKLHRGNFDKNMNLSQEAIIDLKWWVTALPTAYNLINHGDPQVTMTTDASLIGWGCCIDTVTSGGNWSPEEAQHDINYLEMLAVSLALKSFSSVVQGKHVKLLVDNTTAVTTINQMGTCHSRVNNQLSHQIWLWCIDHSVWLSVAHIPGKQNTEADRESRLPRKETEWTLQKPIFDAATKKLGVTPNVDLFASRLNFQLKPYVAYQPDPEAHAINAFHISWKGYTFYAFPPFSVIQRVLQKISDEEATGLLVVPHWPTQTWWPYLMNMLIDFPLMLPRKEDTLYLPAHPHLLHPLHKKLQLLVCHLSGISLQAEEFRLGLQRSSCNPGERVHKSSTRLTTSDGKSSVVQGVLIPFQLL